MLAIGLIVDARQDNEPQTLQTLLAASPAGIVSGKAFRESPPQAEEPSPLHLTKCCASASVWLCSRPSFTEAESTK